jgi:hypothetical protein
VPSADDRGRLQTLFEKKMSIARWVPRSVRRALQQSGAFPEHVKEALLLTNDIASGHFGSQRARPVSYRLTGGLSDQAALQALPFGFRARGGG